jgi:hypothetical protein
MIVSFNLVSDYKRLIAFDGSPFPAIAPNLSC